MTSRRERVLAAINHEDTDRTPADLWAEPEVWDRLVRDMRVSTRDQVLDRLDVDVRYISPIYPPDVVRDGVRQNMWGERWARVNTPWGEDWEHINGALASATTLDEIMSFPWPNCDMVDYSTIKEQCDRYEGCAIGLGDADFFERPALVRGLENMLCDTALNPEWVDCLTGVFTDFFIEDFLRCMKASGGRIDFFRALTDLGTQQGLLTSMDTFRRFIKPPLRKLIDAVHREGVKFMFHSCGAVREVVPDLIEIGVDILNPIQPAAAGMEPDGLKRDFGRDICFHGGIDVQYLLPQGSAGAVREEVHRRVKILGAGGGYILAPSHNLQQDIPTENILALYDVSLRS